MIGLDYDLTDDRGIGSNRLRYIEDSLLERSLDGTLYVELHKNKERWQFNNVELETYQAFSTDGVSKGKFIDTTLNYYSNSLAKDETYFTW